MILNHETFNLNIFNVKIINLICFLKLRSWYLSCIYLINYNKVILQKLITNIIILANSC